MKPIELSQSRLFKRGSAWALPFRRLADGVPVDLTGLTLRAMFRAGSVDGPALVTLTEGAGITRTSETLIELLLMPAQTVLFAPADKVFFDVEMTPVDGRTWQSPTYFFKVAQEVTRDD